MDGMVVRGIRGWPRVSVVCREVHLVELKYHWECRCFWMHLGNLKKVYLAWACEIIQADQAPWQQNKQNHKQPETSVSGMGM
jgi:hypothetical protein